MYKWVQILGDYNSSTKYLHNLCEGYLNIKVSSGHYLHKHQYFPIEFCKNNPDILFIIVHRNFVSWIGSCYRHPHLLLNEKGQIEQQSDRTINDMIKCKIGFQNECNYGSKEMREYYKTLKTTWYESMMDYRNKKTEFYLKLLQFDNVIAINDKDLLKKSNLLLNKLSKTYKITKSPKNITLRYTKNWTIYSELDTVIINRKLNYDNEILLLKKSIKLIL